MSHALKWLNATSVHLYRPDKQGRYDLKTLWVAYGQNQMETQCLFGLVLGRVLLKIGRKGRPVGIDLVLST